MPFAAPNKLDEERDPNLKNNNGVNVSGQSTSFSTGIPGQEAGDNGRPQKSSGQYANIQSYLDANKPQATNMGNTIANQVTTKADDAKQKIASFASQAPRVEAYDPNKVLNNVTTASAADKDNYRMTKQTGGYSGPQSLDQAQGYQDMTRAAQDASKAVQASGNEAGQQQLLRETYNRPKYSAGENKLDQVLLQGSPESKTRLQELSQRYSGLTQALDGANQKVGTAINQATTQALNNKNAIVKAEEAAVQGLMNPIQQRANQANAYNANYIDRVKDDVSDETLSEETLKALGLSEGQSLFDLDLSNYVNTDRTQVGVDNIADSTERTRYAALMDLLDNQGVRQITADGKAINPVSLNQEQFNKDLQAKAAEYDNAYKTFTGNIWLPQFSKFDMAVNRGVTPEQIENYWIPYYNDYQANNNGTPWNPDLLESLKSNLAAWKAKYQPNRTVKKG